MASISYCVFENTANDFGRCIEKLEKGYQLSATENEYKNQLYELAKRYIKAYDKYKPIDKGFFLLDKRYFDNDNHSRAELEMMARLDGKHSDFITKYDVSNEDYDCLRDAVENELMFSFNTDYDDYEQIKEDYFIIGYGW